MELKEGMYVRYIRSFKDNIQEKPVVEIDKVKTVDDRIINLENWHETWVYPLNDFVKMLTKEPSFDPIDICEVGDYVNGCIVSRIFEEEPVEAGKMIEVKDNDKGWRTMYENSEIKTIVTKEMFESMSYKVDDAK